MDTKIIPDNNLAPPDRVKPLSSSLYINQRDTATGV